MHGRPSGQDLDLLRTVEGHVDIIGQVLGLGVDAWIDQPSRGVDPRSQADAFKLLEIDCAAIRSFT